MKSIRNIAATLVIAASLPFASPAQSPEMERSLVCVTSDGTLLITSNLVQIRDYRFEIVDVADNGVILLTDRRSGATAELDMRSPEGLYLAVQDGSAKMQLVAARGAMTLRGSDGNASQPASADAGDNLIVLAQHSPLYSSVR